MDIWYTVCPGSSDPFYIVSQLYKMGHYFLYTKYGANSWQTNMILLGLKNDFFISDSDPKYGRTFSVSIGN